MHARTTRLSRLAAFLVAFWLAQGSVAAASEEVVGRFGDNPKTGVKPERIRIASVSRWGSTLSPGSDLIVKFQQPGQALRFSLGVPLVGSSKVRYRVSARSDSEEWVDVFDEGLAAGKPTWVDRSVKLEGASALASEFRFRAERASTESSAPRRLAAHVGAIRMVRATISQRDRPNIVLISLDTLGARYMGFYGNPAPATPKLDAWFRDAFTFRRTYAPYGNTLVSHSSLFSGLYPKDHQRIEGTFPQPKLNSLVAAFGQAGYHTAAVTENGYVNSGFGFDVGFDSYDDGPNKLLRKMRPGERTGAKETFRRASEWLDENSQGPPFFLFVHTYEVHTPYHISSKAGRRLADSLTPDDTRDLGDRTGEMVAKYNRREMELTRADLDRLSALYQGRVRTLDDLTANFLAGIAARGLADNTIVVITSDHGEQFGEYGKLGHGDSLHGTVLQIPLAIRWPGHITPGRSTADVELIDVMPSVMELAGIPLRKGVTGRSLAPTLLQHDTPIPDEPSFSELRRTTAGCDQKAKKTKGGKETKKAKQGECRKLWIAARHQNWKLIRSVDGTERRLVRLDEDPGEKIDLSKVRPEKVAELSKMIDQYIGGAKTDHEAKPKAEFEAELDEAVAERLRALGYLD